MESCRLCKKNFVRMSLKVFSLGWFLVIVYCYIQGTKLTFLARSCLAPKFSKVVAKANKLGAIKKKKIVEKMHYTVASNGRVFLAWK